MRIANKNVRLNGDAAGRGPFDENIVHMTSRDEWQGEHIFTVPCVNITFGLRSENLKVTDDPITCLECLAEAPCDP